MVDLVDEVHLLAGHLVRVLHRSGDDSLVILASGCGMGAELWRDVVAILPGAVVALDRPGLGGTPWRGRLPTLHDEADLIAAVAGRWSAGRRVIVVAHSMAGFHAEAFGRRYPDQLAGLLLVDASIPDAAWPPHADATPLAMMARSRLAAPFSRLLGASWHARHHGPDGRAAAVSEFFAYRGQARALLALRQTHPWPAVETTVLTARASALSQRWVAAQAQHADVFGARHLIHRSGHDMMLDHPQLVVREITRMRKLVARA